MRITTVLAIATLIGALEARAASGVNALIGYSAVVVIGGGGALAVVGLELLAAVVVATYIVVLLVLFVIALGWRGANTVRRQVLTTATTVALAATLAPLVLSVTAPAVDTAQYTSHASVVGVTQLTFAGVMQVAFSRVFLSEFVAINALILCGFQAVAGVMRAEVVGLARAARADLRARRAWRRSPASRYVG